MSTLRLSLAAALAAAACGRSSPAPSRPTSGTAAEGGAADSVSVAYGAQPREKVMGAVSTVPEEAMLQRPFRIESLLRGRVPGLQIVQGPQGPSFRLRGTQSMTQDQDALFVLDGVMIPAGSVNSTLAGLLPDDIKAISVLRDVASTSVYGARGAGGVILITTKK